MQVTKSYNQDKQLCTTLCENRDEITFLCIDAFVQLIKLKRILHCRAGW